MKMICRFKQSNINITAYRSKNSLLFAVFFIFIFLLPKINEAQISLKDSNINTIFSNKFFQSTYIATPLILETYIFKKKDVNFRQMRNEIIPKFHYDYDTYLQFAPLGLTFALKNFGFTSHSSWLQLSFSTLLSYGLGYGTAKIIKENYEELRPDWGGLKSFPSGHTTIAFVSASILSKEYKQNYPWLSIAGYSMATVTGLSRVMNNRHWMHDVMAGAGIGILATELSYALTDCIFDNKQNKDFLPTKYEFINEKPHFINFYFAYSKTLNKYPKPSGSDMKYTIHSGSSFGGESAYFINNKLGIHFKTQIDAFWFDNNNIDWSADSVFNIYRTEIGSIVSYPLIHRCFVGMHANIGISHLKQQMMQYYMVLEKQNHVSYSCGAFINFWTDRHTFLRFYTDYSYTKLKVDNKIQPFSTLYFGCSIALHL